MIVVYTHEQLCKLSERLCAIAAEPEPYHWIGGKDTGEEFCRACAEKRVKALQAKDPTGEYWVDGGWIRESDFSVACTDCGTITGYSLTDYGFCEELEHFENALFDAAHPLTPETAYEIDRLLWAVDRDSADDMARVIALAEHALSFPPVEIGSRDILQR